jgi:thioredoxin 1
MILIASFGLALIIGLGRKQIMKDHSKTRVLLVFLLGIALLLSPMDTIFAEPAVPPEIPVKDRVTMVDFGAPFCEPCKAMAPFLEKLEKEYKGRAAIVVLDVGKDSDLCERFGIKEIPTQIFFNKKGKEVFRHTGFMKEEAIVKQLKQMGVK